MLIALAVICTLCEAVFTALEVAMSAVSRARLRSIIEAASVQQAQAEQHAQRAPQVASSQAASSDAPAAVSSSVVSSPAPATATQSATDNHAPVVVASRDSRKAASALRLLEQPERLTALFITVTSLSLWTAASSLAWQSLSDDWPDWMLPLALLVILFVAEVLPLLLAAHRAEAVAMGGAGLMQSGLRLLSPLLRALGGLGYGLARLMGAGPILTTQVTEGELRTALATAEQEGVIESEERAMLEGAMSLRETPVREVMTPRGDMIAVSGDEPLHRVLETAMREGHSRLPVFDGTLDSIIGIVSTKDLIPHLRRPATAASTSAAPAQPQAPRTPLTVRDVARPAFFVSEDKRIEPAVEDLRRQRSLMAIVRDAGGATAGLVTLEDLLEEIVGEIQDEYDEAEPSLRVVDDVEDDTGEENGAEVPRAVLCDAEVSVRDFERFWKRSFDETVRLQIAGDPTVSTAVRGANEESAPRDNHSVSDNVGSGYNPNRTADASLSVGELAMHLLSRAPQTGDCVEAGHVTNAFAANEREANERAAVGDGSTGPVLQLQVTAMDGPRITQVRLQKARRDRRGTTSDS